MATTDTNVPQVIVNKLTSVEYAAATKNPTEFYAVMDAKVDTADIQDGAVTGGKLSLSYATVFANNQSLVQNSYKAVIFDPTKNSSGHGKSLIQGNLTYDTVDNCITIGSGVSVVEVSAGIMFENGVTDESYWVVISLNDTVGANRICSDAGSMTSGQKTVASMSPAVLSVSSGDKIRLLVYTSSSTASVRGENASTYITVKQVA